MSPQRIYKVLYYCNFNRKVVQSVIMSAQESQRLYVERINFDALFSVAEEAIPEEFRAENQEIPMVNAYLSGIDRDADVTRRMFAMERMVGSKLSRHASVEVYIRETLIRELEMQAAGSLAANDLSGFLLNIDCAIGVGKSLVPITLAEMAIGGTEADHITQAISSAKSVPGMPQLSIDSDLDIFFALRERGRRYQDLLIRDSSGFSLLDSFLAETRENPESILGNLRPRVILLEGIRMGVEAYKKLYPLTEKPA